ncbi:NAD(P)H-hydrate epimerase [Candidatus Daviesbacteria bacterium]|nr:NAD(P)H-hydrate epimerase [Candidatus Daviesbacteria bacterium]
MIKHIVNYDSASNFPVTRNQMRQLDKTAIEAYGVDLLQMMELAGFKLAQFIHDNYSNGHSQSILVVAGSGNNGGGGLVATRHLHNFGHRVFLYLTNEQNMKLAPAHQLKTIEQMNIRKLSLLDDLESIDLIVDALIGYGQIGEVREDISKIIGQINRLNKKIISLDNPSGLDVDTGTSSENTIKATATVTLAALKKGLLNNEAKTYVGNIYLADIGIPKEAYKDLSVGYPFTLVAAETL